MPFGLYLRQEIFKRHCVIRAHARSLSATFGGFNRHLAGFIYLDSFFMNDTLVTLLILGRQAKRDCYGSKYCGKFPGERPQSSELIMMTCVFHMNTSSYEAFASSVVGLKNQIYTF